MILTNSDRVTVSLSKILGLLTACIYVFFTLVPDSHSLFVLYPFVTIWQIGLMFPVLWLLVLMWQGKVHPLGNGIDWFFGIFVSGLLISTIFAEFPQQAIWYGWAACSFIAIVYVLNSILSTPQVRYRLLVRQGYLSLAFIVVSLLLWTTQTFLPEIDRLAQLKLQGINLSFDFSVLELRNWAPIGHQNYVAGYLLLAIPLLLGLGIVERGWRRWFWVTGVILGLVDLYTTSSKGGWLAMSLTFVVGFGIILTFSSLSRIRIAAIGCGGAVAIFGILLTNNRFLQLLQRIIQGQGTNELVYRNINAVLGWRMGISHFFTGAGLGSVPLMYQQYRPFWAGRESELVYQLHSTPVQLWAELGIWGALLFISAFGVLGFSVIKLLRYSFAIKQTDYIFYWCLCISFLAYGIMSLTDYQLDNICISGTLVLFLACITSILRDNQESKLEKSENLFSNISRYLSLGGLGVAIALTIWLIPVHHAWQLSSQGFYALANKDLNTFIKRLDKAQQITPWESYYPYQLGWSLGDLAITTPVRRHKQALLTQASNYLMQANQVSPYREFGHSNLGWLLLQQNPSAATQSFKHSAELVPAKQGVFLGLGLSLLAQQQVDLALEAFTLEALREPMTIVSPVWRSPELRPIYKQLLTQTATTYNQLIETNPDNSYLQKCRGSLFWWRGNMSAAAQDWQDSPLNKLLLQINSDSQLQTELSKINSSPAKLVIEAWFDKAKREQLLTQAWLLQTRSTIPETILSKLSSSMTKATSFEQWLKVYAPIAPYRSQRSGFGVISRHVDGQIPSDYFLAVDNIAIATWYSSLFSAPKYDPDLERLLQPKRDALLAKIKLTIETNKK